MAFSRARLAIKSLFPDTSADHATNWRAVQQWEWDMPWGNVYSGVVEGGAFTAIAANTETLLIDAGNVTFYKNRKYNIRASVCAYAPLVAGVAAGAFITNADASARWYLNGAVQENTEVLLSNATGTWMHMDYYYLSGVTATVPVKWTIICVANPITWVADAGRGNSFFIDDIGPSGPQ